MSSALRLGLARLAHSIASTAPSTAPARAFSSTPALLKTPTGNWRQGQPQDNEAASLPIPKPYARDAHIPAYPYGPRTAYKQSNAGLYGLARIRFGNNVSSKHNVKTPRKWRPNVHRKILWSMALRCWVQTRLTMRVLRSIDKAGGLDSYLLGTKPRRIKELGPWGWKLRWRIMQSPLIKKQFRDQRMALGLPPTKEELEEIERELQEARERQSADAMRPSEGAEGMGPVTDEGLMAEIDGMIESGDAFSLGMDEHSTSEPGDLSASQSDIAPGLEKLPLEPEAPSPGPEVTAPGLDHLAPRSDELSPALRDPTAPASQGLQTPPEDLSPPGLKDQTSGPKRTSRPKAATAGPEAVKDEGFMKEKP